MILSPDHYPLVENLIRSVHHTTSGHYNLDRGLYYIKNRYLTGECDQHMFGSFENDELISVCGLRMYYPDKQSACISNVFYQAKNLNFKQKVKASEEAYMYAFERGCLKVFSAMKSDQYQSQWNLVTRYSPFLSSLKVKELEIIKAETKGSMDWMNSLLGRMVHSVDYTIREVSQ